jgi:hypothetical protein
MSQDAWNDSSTEPSVVKTIVKFTGTGASQPTKVLGRGITLNRTGVGIIDIVWVEFPGAYVGITGHCFEATTASAVKGYTVVPGAFNTTTRTLTINMTSAADALVDLAALQQLTLEIAFKRTSLAT